MAQHFLRPALLRAAAVLLAPLFLIPTAGLRPAHAQDVAVETPEAPPEAPPTDTQAPDRGAVRSENVRDFRPREVASIIPAEAINLREVFEELGRDAAQWYQHVLTLSNPFFEGRCPGTRGHELAVEYLEFYFRQYGLSPAFTPDSDDDQLGGASLLAASYQQEFSFQSPDPTVEVDVARMFINDRPLQLGKDFNVLGNSGSGSVTAPLAFVGYGIERRNNYSSFDPDVDLTGRAVLLLRYEPLDHEGKSQWAARRFSSESAIQSKVEAVLKRNPSAILLINPPGAADGSSELETPQSSVGFGSSAEVPIVHISIDLAQELLKRADPKGRDLMEWRRLADEGKVRTELLDDAVIVKIETAVTRSEEALGRNVAGAVPGRGDLADEWVVIGGHFDHVGYGHFGSGAGEAGYDVVHPGADDNASGTAGVLHLARKLKQRCDEEDGDNISRRSLLFLAFSAEESGLHGSRAFTEHPSFPLDHAAVMINMDMIGRLRDNQLSVSGTGTAEEFSEILPELFEASGLDIQSVETGSGPSDHANFYQAGVPVLFLFTGVHDEYHKPQDEGWTVNPSGAMKVLELAEDITWDLAHRPQRLTYKKAAPGEGRDRGYAKVRLGIRPDMGAEHGIVVQEVSEGTSAADAGIQPGDILLEWNGTGLDTMRALFESLQMHEPGDVVQLKIRRGEEELTIPVTLKASEEP